MAEYIERKKAIELIQPHVKPQTIYGEGYLQAIEHATDILELMPAADVQPVKHGEWTWNSEAIFGNPYGSYECSECGNRADFKYNYCCSCGAEMKNAE